jgi:hypothetical protein
MELWDQQPGESAKAFAGFVAYRDLGPNRSLAQAAKVEGKSTTMLERWSVGHDWRQRVRAYDASLDRQARQAFEAERIAMRKRHIAIGLRLQNRALDKLEALTREELSVHQALRLFKIGVRLERQARRELVDLLVLEMTEEAGVDLHVMKVTMAALAEWVHQQNPGLADSLIASFDRMKAQYG